ncbi:MAG: hypothetical protein K2V38_07975, partial [Gemmataceae bacterium]|nr:hypothetical protein [Gemmataceae bacterium]
EGTVASRLARGRALLADRLSRRGLALPAAGLAAVLGADTNASAAGSLPATPSAVAEALAAEVARALPGSFPRATALGVLGLLGATGLVVATAWTLGGFEPPNGVPSAPSVKAVEGARPPAKGDKGEKGAAPKPTRFVLRNPAGDIAVVSDRDEPFADFFRRQPVLVAKVRAELRAELLAGKGEPKPLDFTFVDDASFNTDGPRVAVYGASVRLVPVPPADPAFRLLDAADRRDAVVFVRDPVDRNVWHPVGFTRRPSAGFFASGERVGPDTFAPADLLQRGEKK